MQTENRLTGTQVLLRGTPINGKGKFTNANCEVILQYNHKYTAKAALSLQTSV